MNGQDFTHIATMLDEGDIKTIVIIDDVYDPPQKARFFQNEIEDFWTELETNDEALQELEQIGIKISAPDDINDTIIQELWGLREQKSVLCEICKTTLFTGIVEDLNQLENFRGHLNDLGREVIVLGRSSNLDEYLDKAVKLIFIDYYLGPMQEPEASVRASIDKIKEIYSKYQPKPLVILMSSRDPSSEMIAQFRDDSELLEGMFHFIPKQDFYQKDKLSLKLGAFAKALPAGYKIQHFVDALKQSMDTVSKKFLADIRKLSLNDYAYIQKLSLQTDGHPLGDYMLWLYSAYFGHLLFENEETVRRHRDEIDKLKFEHLPPIHASPSLQLAEIYKSALFDMSIGDITKHPLGTDNQANSQPNDNPPLTVPSSDVLKQPYLHLGDFFIKDASKDVLMIINAQCDLEFAPGNKNRQFPSEQPIILIPGELHPLNKKIEEPNKIRTELFEYKGGKYRILWNIEQVVVHPYKEIAGWLNKETFKRVARLRLPFALEIQRAFTVNLTRIGMPVAPPIYQPVQVQLFIKGEDNNHALLESPPEGLAFLALTKDGEQCMLTMDCILLLLNYIAQLGEKFEEKTKSLDPASTGYETTLKRLLNHKDELLASLTNYQSWLQMLIPFPLKIGEEKVFSGIPIKICRDKSIEGQYSHKEKLLINIISILTEQEENKSDQANTSHPELIGRKG